MLPGMELMGCTGLAVPADVMHHVVQVESSYNPYAIGVVGGRLARQPRSLEEAVSTTRMLEREGYNFSLGLAQVNRHNLRHYGLDSHEKAFDVCPNLRAGAQILAECRTRAGGDWGKALSCYYSGNFVTGYQHGYVQRVLASWQAVAPAQSIPLIRNAATAGRATIPDASARRVADRVQEASRVPSKSGARMGSAIEARAPSVETSIRWAAAADIEHPSPIPQPPAAPIDDSGPVTVRLTAAPTPHPTSTSSTGRPSAPQGERVDAAFVF